MWKNGLTAEAQSTQRFLFSNSFLRDLSVSAVNYPKTSVCFVIFVVSETNADNQR
jgi:hypothetical protein